MKLADKVLSKTEAQDDNQAEVKKGSLNIAFEYEIRIWKDGQYEFSKLHAKGQSPDVDTEDFVRDMVKKKEGVK